MKYKIVESKMRSEKIEVRTKKIEKRK